jgi:hypothetical protein
MNMKTTGTLIVLLRLAILFAHGAAHTHLHIDTNAWQTAFIASVIFAGPILASILLWTRMQRLGLVLLGLTMAGSFVFGLYFHFIAAGPDNAAGLSNAGWGGMFRATSVLLAITEAFACFWCAWALKRRESQSELQKA